MVVGVPFCIGLPFILLDHGLFLNELVIIERLCDSDVVFALESFDFIYGDILALLYFMELFETLRQSLCIFCNLGFCHITPAKMLTENKELVKHSIIKITY